MGGPPPKDPRLRRRRNVPAAGEWQAAAGVGWQHGDPPDPPDGLLAASREAWQVWMGAWFSAHWGPADLPGLVVVIRLYDLVERGEFRRAAELRLWEDTYGITPKGQQNRRWARPDDDVAPVRSSDRRKRLKIVD